MIDIIKKILNEKKLDYLFKDDLFEVFVGSFNCYIQVESDTFAQFFDDYYELELYNDTLDLSNESEDIYFEQYVEESIDKLIDFVVIKAKAINKIKNKIQEIKLICDELYIDIDYFISFNYDSLYEDN